MKILKGIILTALSIVLTGALGYSTLMLVMSLNYLGIFLALALVTAYVIILYFLKNKLFSARLLEVLEISTVVFWGIAFLVVMYLDETGYWSGQFLGGLVEFLLSMFSLIVAVANFVLTNIVFLIKNSKNLKTAKK